MCDLTQRKILAATFLHKKEEWPQVSPPSLLKFGRSVAQGLVQLYCYLLIYLSLITVCKIKLGKLSLAAV